MELTNSEIEKEIDVDYIATSTIGYALPVGKNEIIDISSLLKNVFPNEVRINITIDVN